MNPKLTYHLRMNILPTSGLLVLLALLMALAGHATELSPAAGPAAADASIPRITVQH